MRGDRYEVDGPGFNSLAGAIRRARQRAQAEGMPEAETRAGTAYIDEQYRWARRGKEEADPDSGQVRL